MPSPDFNLDRLVSELGTINVPELVRLLVEVHPTHCPSDLALRALDALLPSSFTLDFCPRKQ